MNLDDDAGSRGHSGKGVEEHVGAGDDGLGPSREVAGQLVRATDDTVSAVLLFGSRLVGSRPDPHSAHDLVVLVDGYRPFYEALVRAGHHGRSPRLLAALSRILPPNVVAVLPSGPDGPVAKCMVLTEGDFLRALRPGATDHFVKGRMVQRVALLHARSGAVRRRVEEGLAGARRDVVRWVGPFLGASFGAEEVARMMLRVSYRGEIRPEAGDRVEEVFRAQRDALVAMYRGVLEEAGAAGEVERAEAGGHGDGERVERRWRLASPPTRWARLRIRGYFFRSKARVTMRWFKHIVTYDDWLTYIRRKVERRTGMRVELTRLERKYPLIFLWPRVVRVLAARPERAPEGQDRAVGGGDGGRGEPRSEPDGDAR